MLTRRSFLLGVLGSVISSDPPATRHAVVMVSFGEGKTRQFAIIAARALSRDDTENTVRIPFWRASAGRSIGEGQGCTHGVLGPGRRLDQVDLEFEPV